MTAWEKLVCLTEDELARIDIAEVNSACAVGLPGTESLDVSFCRKTLDEWADKVRWQTIKHFPQFERRPHDFYYSRSYFRVLALITVVQRERNILGLEALENMLNDPELERNWWEPMRGKKWLTKRPSTAFVDFSGSGCRIRFAATLEAAYSINVGARLA